MIAYTKIRSYAKINLSLNVVGKKQSLHKIESIISFINLHDKISVKATKEKNHKIKFTGKFSKGIKTNNTISQLLKIIDKDRLLKGKKFEILIEKNIPTMAGFGGGSMNAASILKFLIENKFFSLSKKSINDICYSIGSDVILGMYNKNLILKANKEINEFIVKKKVFTLLIKPPFGCSTKKIFSKVKHFKKNKLNKSSIAMFDLNYLKKMNNDLEEVVTNEHPKVNSLKNFLKKLPKVEFVRMTGSGSAFIAYFQSSKMCKLAEKKVKKNFKNYWCKIAKTI